LGIRTVSGSAGVNNVISGNTTDRIRLGSGVTTIVAGNKIGVGEDVTIQLANGDEDTDANTLLNFPVSGRFKCFQNSSSGSTRNTTMFRITAKRQTITSE